MSFWIELPREGGSNSEKKGEVRLQDRLQALRSRGDQGVLCWRAYKHFRRCGIKPDLGVIMRGLLTPQDISDIEEKAEAIRENCGTVLERKNVASQTFVGRGLLLITISLIKQSWYTEMRTKVKPTRTRMAKTRRQRKENQILLWSVAGRWSFQRRGRCRRQE